MYGKAACPVPRGTGDQPGYGRDIVAPPRKQVVTEKTNFFLQSRKAPVYSNKIFAKQKGRKNLAILGKMARRKDENLAV